MKASDIRHYNNFDGIYFRNDDVLLTTHLTGSMKNSLRYNTFFGHFKETDKIFAEHNTPCILTILAEGIEHNPEWVQYIKDRQYRYIIEMHGYFHSYYNGMPEEEAYHDLLKAKDLIEKTFNVKISRWYVPFSKKGFPEWGHRVCQRLGIKFHTHKSEKRCLYFHYWQSRDRKILQTLFNLKYGIERSQTTGVVSKDH